MAKGHGSAMEVARISKQCHKEGHCYHCGRKLTERTQLDLNNDTGEWSSAGWDESVSQGWFDFGPDCAVRLDVATDPKRKAIRTMQVALHKLDCVAFLTVEGDTDGIKNELCEAIAALSRTA